jgi:four helix bundle protein
VKAGVQNTGENIEFGRGGVARATAKSFQDLIVWQKAHRFVMGVYRFTNQFPKSESYGLTSQLRRAAVSVPGNIAEGFKKRGRADKVRILNIARGSLEEARYYLILSRDLGYGDPSSLLRSVEEVSELLEAYRGTILNSEF